MARFTDSPKLRVNNSLTQFVSVYDGNSPELCPDETLAAFLLGPSVLQMDHLFFDQGLLNELSQLPFLATLPVVCQSSFLGWESMATGNMSCALQLQQRKVLG